MNGRYPLVPMRYPVFFRHFIGRVKPDRESKGAYDARFNHAYRHFFETMWPEGLTLLAPPCDPMPMPLRDLVNLMLRHRRVTGIMRKMLTRFSDPYRAEI